MINEILLSIVTSASLIPREMTFFANNAFLESQGDFQTVLVTTPSGKNYYVKQYIGLLDNPGTNEIITPTSYYSSATLEPGYGPSYTYNCHSFAWLYDGNVSNIPSLNDRCCVDDPSPFINLMPYCYYDYDEYQNPSQIADASSICVGDIIVYYDVDQSSSNAIISHSAVVTESSSNINSVMVRSKWRFGGVYNHTIFACPYYTPAYSLGWQSNDESTIGVFKISHSLHYEYVSPLKHSVSTNCCGRNMGLKNHSFVYLNGSYYCSKCNFQTNILPYSYGGEIDE